jgi:hypothetical protein
MIPQDGYIDGIIIDKSVHPRSVLLEKSSSVLGSISKSLFLSKNIV